MAFTACVKAVPSVHCEDTQFMSPLPSANYLRTRRQRKARFVTESKLSHAYTRIEELEQQLALHADTEHGSAIDIESPETSMLQEDSYIDDACNVDISEVAARIHSLVLGQRVMHKVACNRIDNIVALGVEQLDEYVPLPMSKVYNS